MRAIVMREFGGPDVLRLEDAPEPTPRAGHALVEVTLAGVNYADVHVRGDTYLAPVDLPYIPGNEVVGTLDGRRVVGLTRGGGYAERTLLHRRVTWDVPDAVSDGQAVALALQGNSAWHLLFTALRLTKGETVVVPAAAGGVGTLAVQLAARAGAKVIGLAGSAAKRQLALELGAHAVVDSTAEDLTERILDAAGGPVETALEMTGGATFARTLAALAPRGRLAVYGFAGGELADVSTRELMERSLTVSGFWLPQLYGDRTALPTSMRALFDAVADGSLTTLTGATYALGEAAQAHHDLAARTPTGKLALDVTR
ncbi:MULTISPECIES: quinone oxidoreductase family protein [Streptomyces]|uniref:NADPH:quinone reductase n=1 Tax=Streptomyces noursei TaxID=1971 RepID=A0A059VZX2_STRNR|nr:zinc-binding dehydrogenase [Streptomyces noursei]AKA03355.1 alcohol dehydrogenase [Streptomyces noursei ZPM]AIA02955.1 alcohol dehydrogenase zinc-binding domain protein [Streptomyces noursei]EOT00708.1 alcohol dehydrogenase [Streptomyces noursei CCRC 11814]EXU89411.1 NADPH:quinone reductase [Streptomyces noursei PD-1]UWS71747.1 zinc-binding dehydrogenase [Streptomyces noursei]